MGTRHLIAVKKDGEYKIAQYGQWNGDPGGQGIAILGFLEKKKDLDSLTKNLSKIRFIDDEKDKDWLDLYNENAPKYHGDPETRTLEQIKWFETYMTRDLGSDILDNIANSEDKEILLRNQIGFAGDSLFCEYAYVIDFDESTFEIFEGFNKNELGEDERFFETVSKCEYKPVKLVKKYNLGYLPTQEKFLEDLIKEEED